MSMGISLVNVMKARPNNSSAGNLSEVFVRGKMGEI